MKNLAVLLTVHNRREKTLACLSRLFSMKTEGWTVDVYLTDDGCTDGTPEEVSARFPGVVIVKGDGSLYWNRGMLAAWRRAVSEKDYDAYLWLNDDTILEEGALGELLAASEQHPEALISGATRSAVTGEVTYGGFDSRERQLAPDGTFRHCATVNGNIVLVSRYVFDRLGYLDPVFTHCMGDVDYGLRANEAGIEVLLMPRYCGTCERNASTPKWRDSSVPFPKRLRALWHPLSYSRPPEWFHYKRRHAGLLAACLSMGSIALNVISPKLWKKLRR